MTAKKTRRDLALIATELRTALLRQTADIITIGGLLIEAQDQLAHGAWLPWLKENFGSSVKTATNYMNAARFAAKSATVAGLKLRPSALYVLGRELYGLDDADSLYNCKAIAAILTAAETEWINAERAREIAKSLLPPPPAEPVDEIEEIKAELAAREERRAAERAAQAEIDDILDGPPPELPPAPEPVADDFTLKSFNEAVATLFRLHTKPLNSFTAAAHAPAILNTIARFMTEVAGQSADPICSYCCSERTRASTGKLPLFKGERAYICAECIEIATGMLADLKAKKVVEPAQAHPF